jgi:hypothetical protein
MTIDETIKHFKEFETFMRRDLPNELTKIAAHNTVAQIHTRVIDKQVNAKGQRFGRYSTRPTLSSGTTEKSKRVFNALAGSKKKRSELDWVTIKRKGKNVHLFVVKGGYQEIREIEGFSNEYKSFEFTTEMWRGFGVKRTEKSSGRFTVVLGGKNSESQNKIDWNSEREGVDIIDASRQEQNFIKKQVEIEIDKYLKRAKLK